MIFDVWLLISISALVYTAYGFFKTPSDRSKFILANTFWLQVLVLTFYLAGFQWPFWALTTCSAIMRTIEEIGDHRPGWTWLPPWFVEKKKDRIVDGYHISFRLMRDFYLWAGAVWMLCGGSFVDLIFIYPLQWLFDGFTSNLFYHVNFMRKEKREFERLYSDFVDGFWWLLRKI